MKNLYANTQSNGIIHISEVDKNNREKYFCCNCKNELIARKGKVYAHHFSHKSDTNCSYETYLHETAKKMFYNNYSNALKNNTPFWFEYEIESKCNTCINIKGLNISCNLSKQIERFDLTKRYDIVEMEKGHNGFIIDVLLKSSTSDDSIYVEIAVTHKSEDKKIVSKAKILEFNIINENDFKLFSDNQIKISKKIDYYNFKKVKKDTNLNNLECNRKVSAFFVYDNGKAKTLELQMKELMNKINSISFRHFEVLYNIKDFIAEETSDDEWEFYEEDWSEEHRRTHHRSLFHNCVMRASYNGINIRNCFSCRFFTHNNSVFGIYPYFCKKLKCEIENSNDGYQCNKFWRIKTPHNNQYKQ